MTIDIIGDPITQEGIPHIPLDLIAEDLEKAGAFKANCEDIVAVLAGILCRRVHLMRKQIDDFLKEEGWKEDPYSHGMANGMVAALNIVNETTPKFIGLKAQTYSKSASETLQNMFDNMGPDLFGKAMKKALKESDKADELKELLKELIDG